MNWLSLLAAEAPNRPEVAPPSPTGAADRWIEAALFGVVDVGIVLIAVAIVLCLIRILKGPSLPDRGLAADTIAVQVAGLVILLTIRLETLMLFDAVLIVSILGFVSTVAFAQYIGRRRQA